MSYAPTIPDHLQECLIEEATCVVNARGEAFKSYSWNQFGENLLRVHLYPVIPSANNNMNQAELRNACLTPCKPKPVFVEAVSENRIQSITGSEDSPHLCFIISRIGQFSYAQMSFAKADLAGIESVPLDELEIVLRRKAKK